ncbi:hypothetical protein EV356DRAFT_568897 [Viridothelium virens]|uniref:Uncharacterized protein n=1 Tax=Viridothelium virens TaxID=1048519 RepID=A0A6A6H2S6_VIRVR|nr:hypothetical protein EV356DRAFT_568897 [Viridothelium virens]
MNRRFFIEIRAWPHDTEGYLKQEEGISASTAVLSSIGDQGSLDGAILGKHVFQSIIEAQEASLQAKPNTTIRRITTRKTQTERGQGDDYPCDCPLIFVVGSDTQDRKEFSISFTLASRHSPWIAQICAEGKEYRKRLEAVKRVGHILKHAIIKAGDYPGYLKPKIDKSRPAKIYAEALVKVCHEYPWAESAEHFSYAIAHYLGISKEDFDKQKQNRMTLLQIIRPQLEKGDGDLLKDAVRNINNKIKALIANEGTDNPPLDPVKAVARNRIYLPDEDPSVVELLTEHLEVEHVSVLSTPELLHLYILAETLRMQEFRNNIIEKLGWLSRHGEYLTRDETVLFACKRCTHGSPLRRLVVDMLVYTKPSSHVLAMVHLLEDHDINYCIIETLMARIGKAHLA